MKNKKVVLITGCSTGIGRELCIQLAKKGFSVVATARDKNTLDSLPVSLKLQLDVTNKTSITNTIQETLLKFQSIDILINNAGYSIRGALEEIKVENIKNMFDVNVFGIINMVQVIAPLMRENLGGKIINIGSISGKFTQPINGAYCASKHSVEALSDAMRYELHNQNIQVTVIEPGPIQTNFFKTMEKHSAELLTNSFSYYEDLYLSDIKHKNNQFYTPLPIAVEKMIKIIEKNSLKSRYEIAVPFVYSMFASFPYCLRDYLMINSR